MGNTSRANAEYAEHSAHQISRSVAFDGRIGEKKCNKVLLLAMEIRCRMGDRKGGDHAVKRKIGWLHCTKFFFGNTAPIASDNTTRPLVTLRTAGVLSADANEG